MDKNNTFSLYDEKLLIINGIKFTHREIDVITSIFHLRGASKIASILFISTRTVESHIANIMRKMSTNSRDGIIDIVQKSGNLSTIKNHYNSLILQIEFKKTLNLIKTLLKNKPHTCSIFFDSTLEDEEGNKGEMIRNLIGNIKDHLTLCGIKSVLIEKNANTQDEPAPLDTFLFSADSMYHGLFIIPLNDLQVSDPLYGCNVNNLIEKADVPQPCVTFIRWSMQNEPHENHIPPPYGFINFYKNQNYFSFFFTLIKRICPHLNVDKITENFLKNENSACEINNTNTVAPATLENFFSFMPLRYRKSYFSAGVILLFLSVIYFSEKQKGFSHLPAPIRSDFIVPTTEIFLDRPNIIKKVAYALKESMENIRTVALVGIAGAGKTTIARKYALENEANVVWEINAATKETLKDSFERLAHALCQTDEDQQALQGIQVIKNTFEKEEKILHYVKNKLKLISNWLLIYDNVDKLKEVQAYLPCDSKAWGTGKIIITTINGNIGNNSCINTFIKVGHLTADEKLSLFTNIITSKEPSDISHLQGNDLISFLNDVPPFPLDISIAAYYIKSTNTPYNKYLERLKEDHQGDFSVIQADVVQEASGYNKTRYGIITVSLKELINKHKDFSDLLLLISLIGHQNIPRTLLTAYKGDTVVDNFIYHLKMYSLINNKEPAPSIFTISIHKSTQEISLRYLIKTLSLSKEAPTINHIANALDSFISHILDNEDFSGMKLLIPHCEQFLSHDTILHDSIKSSIESALGCIYYYLRHNIKAKQLLESNLPPLKYYFGKNNDKIARILLYLGNFYRTLGGYEKAKDFLEESLSIYKNNPDNLLNAKAMGYLGAVYRDLGNYNKAKILFENSLLIYEKYPKNYIGNAWALAHVGNIYMTLGNLDKAKDLLEKSLHLYEQQSTDYVGVAWVLGYLGNVCNLLGQNQKAKDLLEKSLAIMGKYFADDHIYRASTLSFLGATHISLGNHQEAKQLLNDSLTIYERNYGKNHLETARLFKVLGEAYALEGNIETAEYFFTKSLLIFQHKNHPHCYQPMEGLGNLYIKQFNQTVTDGEIKQSEKFKQKSILYLNQALEVLKNSSLEPSVYAATIKNKLSELQDVNKKLN